MATITRTRGHLRPVPDLGTPTPAAAPLASVTAIGRAEHLSHTYDTASRAAAVPDVTADLDSDITLLMAALAAPGADLHALLREFGTAQYVHGYVDAETTREANLVLAEIHYLDKHRGGGDPA